MKVIHPLLCLFAIAALGLAMIGCETESASTPITVSPDATSLKKGESATFTASGGYDYSWAITTGEQTWGTLSSRTGPSVTYTSQYDPGLGVRTPMVLTVTSTIQPKAITNDTTAYQATADVYITLLGSETNGVGDVFINPPSATIVLGQSIGFVAEGGDGVNYTWALDPSTYGYLTRTTGRDTVYTATTEPTAPTTVYLTLLSAGRSFTASITHQTRSVSAVTVTTDPTSAVVATGGHVILTASGGDGNYTWSIISPANSGEHGYLSSTTGSTVTYYATSASAQTIKIKCVSAGTEFQVIIDQN